jgi:hypothetical protein
MWGEPGANGELNVGHTYAQRHVCHADFFPGGANSTIFPRRSGEIHFCFFRKLFGM